MEVTYAAFRLSCHFATTPYDHRLPFQSYKSWWPCRFGLSTEWDISPDLNRIQLAGVCCCGHNGRVMIDLLARNCLPLGHPSATGGFCAIVQILPSKQQCGERQASLKVALQYPRKFVLHMLKSNVLHCIQNRLKPN